MKIPKELTLPIIEWTIDSKNQNYFVDPNHDTGQVKGIPRLDTLPVILVKNNFPFIELLQIEKLILNYYNIHNTIRDDYFGIFLSYSTEGHIVNPHRDLYTDEYDIVRCNVLISKPIKGGEAIINNKIIEVEENEVWICNANKDPHSSVLVEGDKPRIMLSFGYYFQKV